MQLLLEILQNITIILWNIPKCYRNVYNVPMKNTNVPKYLTKKYLKYIKINNVSL